MSHIAPFAHAGATLIAETGGGPPVGHLEGVTTYVLIHGIGMGRTIFTGLVEKLQELHSARTVAIDLPGYGAAPEPWRVLTMERTADLVAAFLRNRELGPVVVIGHSMGTQVAIELAARHPDLVAGVVLLAPTVNRRERTAARQALRLAQDLAVENPKVIYVGAREYLHAGPNLRRKFRAMLEHRPEITYPHVHVPALVLRGENDYVSPRAWCRFVAAALPQGRLAEVEGHGHETMIRDAGAAAAVIIDFVRHG